MGKVIAGMTISLDEFVNDRNGSVGSLYPDLAALSETEEAQESIKTTGAVMLGRRAYAMGDPDSYADSYEYQVPIFVVTHQVPEKRPKQNEALTFTFVTDGVESAIAQAKAVAGDGDVTVIGGASTFQQCLRAGVVDKLHLDLVPVLLGQGLRLFENLSAEAVELEKPGVTEAPLRTHLKFRVVKGRSMT